MSLGTVGVSAFAPDLADSISTAVAADAAGLDGVWTSELFNRSATVSLTLMADATSRCRVGSSVMYGVGRSPLMLAAEARDIDELSGGRFVLGLGNGTRRMISDWHGLDPEAPAVRMEELIPLVRSLFRLHREPVHHEGRFYRLSIQPIPDGTPPLREQIPIFTGGVNARMIESAGRVADGFIGHPIMSLGYIDDVVRPAIERGAQKTGRDPAGLEVASMVLCSADDDEELARRDAASQLAFYGTVKSYGTVFAHHGFVDQGAAIVAAFRAGDMEAMRDAVTDDMIDTFALTGTPESVAEQLDRPRAALDHVIVSAPTNGVAPERVAENLQRIVAAVGARL